METEKQQRRHRTVEITKRKLYTNIDDATRIENGPAMEDEIRSIEIQKQGLEKIMLSARMMERGGGEIPIVESSWSEYIRALRHKVSLFQIS